MPLSNEWRFLKKLGDSGRTSVLSRFTKGLLIGIVLSLLLQLFFGWP